MTGSTCGTPHYDYPESLCTEPAGHYVRERDPHAAPLIIDGRQCGGLAWDEPEQHVTDRIPLDHLTSDQLDQLYADLDRYEEVQGEMNEHATDQARELAELTRSRDEWKWRAEDAKRGTRCQRERAERAEAVIDGVRHLHRPVGVVAAAEAGIAPDCAACQRSWPCQTYNAVTALSPAATEATDNQEQP